MYCRSIWCPRNQFRIDVILVTASCGEMLLRQSAFSYTELILYKSNETPTWCNTVQVLFLQSHSACFVRKRPSSGVFKNGTVATGTCVIVAGKSSYHLIRALIRWYDDLPATITHVPVAAVLVLNTPDDGRLRPKRVEWLCRNETCTVLYQVCVSFDLYYDARKHKIKKWFFMYLI